VDEAILRAALELFIEHGPDATSIEQISQRAGVARLTVYRRWSNKEELLIAALDQARGIDDSALYQQLLDTDTELTEQELHAAVARLLESMTDVVTRPELRGLIARLIGAASSHPELLRAFWNNYLHPRRQLASTAIRRAIELGGLPATTGPELLMDTIAGATLFTTLLHPDPPTEKELRDRTHAVLRQLGINIPEPNDPPGGASAS
jgi:AcrR family transcriptional regulator